MASLHPAHPASVGAYAPGDAAALPPGGDRHRHPAVDGAVYADAEAAGVWVNSADDAAHCSFILPSVHRDGPVTVAVSTGGPKPRPGRLAARPAGRAGGPGLADLADLLGRARAHCTTRGPEHRGRRLGRAARRPVAGAGGGRTGSPRPAPSSRRPPWEWISLRSPPRHGWATMSTVPATEKDEGHRGRRGTIGHGRRAHRLLRPGGAGAEGEPARPGAGARPATARPRPRAPRRTKMASPAVTHPSRSA